MTKKYIDADALINYLKEQDKKYTDGLTVNEICILIKNYPSADVEPVRRWIPVKEKIPEIESGDNAIEFDREISFIDFKSYDRVFPVDILVMPYVKGTLV